VVGFGVVCVRTTVVVSTWLDKADVVNVMLFNVVVLAEVVGRSVVVGVGSSGVSDVTVLESGMLVAFGRTTGSWRTGAVGVSQNAACAAASTAPNTAPMATRLCPSLVPNTTPP
jgi:hypothetical protein